VTSAEIFNFTDHHVEWGSARWSALECIADLWACCSSRDYSAQHQGYDHQHGRIMDSAAQSPQWGRTPSPCSAP